MHCEQPTCAEVCPADAIKRTGDGVVQSARKPRCIACGNCVVACVGPEGIGHLCGRRRGADDMNRSVRRPFSRDQRTTIINGMLVFVLIVAVLQLWLLTATMNAWLGGDESIVWPGLAVSAGGLALNVGLFAYLRRLERTRGGGT
jgi:hypothetical protein